MDTRKKIVNAAEGQKRHSEWTASGHPVQVVTGYFDPVLSAHALALDNSRIEGGRLMVVLRDPPEPILSSRARAELVAALAAVDAVVTGTVDIPFDAWIDLEQDDLRRRKEFMDHVRRRNDN